MKLATGAQMHALDQKTIQETGIAGIVLMENASRAVAERAATYGLDQRCVVVAGGGNNGGDGFAIARLLRQKGMDVTVVFTGTEEKLPPDARCNYEICHRLGLPVITEMTEGVFFSQEIAIGPHFFDGFISQVFCVNVNTAEETAGMADDFIRKDQLMTGTGQSVIHEPYVVNEVAAGGAADKYLHCSFHSGLGVNGFAIRGACQTKGGDAEVAP